jgi:integrase
VDIRAEGVRYRRRSPENTRAGARAYEAWLRQRLARGEEPGAQKREEPTFAQFAEIWFNGYVVPNNKPSEKVGKRCILDSSLIPWFGNMRLDAIGRKDIELYKAREQQKGTSNKTINNKLAVLRKCLATAYDWEVTRTAPPPVKALKCPPPKTDFLTNDESERLLAHAEGIVHEMILLALKAGLRQGEIRGLQWEAIDWENRILTVRHSLCDYTQGLTSPKSNRERHIPLTADLCELLRARRKSTGYVFTNERGRPFSQSSHLLRLLRAQKRAGLRRIGWHLLRHTFATRLVAMGAPIRTVQELLGHSTINMTMRYAHVAPSNLRAAIHLLDAHSGPAPQFGQPAGNRSVAAR